jgi:cold shock protein
LRLTTGTAKWFNDSKGLGFVTQDDGGDELFADFLEISAAGFKSLQENQKVSFDVKTGPKGKQAANIKPVWGKVCIFESHDGRSVWRRTFKAESCERAWWKSGARHLEIRLGAARKCQSF